MIFFKGNRVHPSDKSMFVALKSHSEEEQKVDARQLGNLWTENIFRAVYIYYFTTSPSLSRCQHSTKTIHHSPIHHNSLFIFLFCALSIQATAAVNLTANLTVDEEIIFTQSCHEYRSFLLAFSLMLLLLCCLYIFFELRWQGWQGIWRDMARLDLFLKEILLSYSQNWYFIDFFGYRWGFMD